MNEIKISNTDILKDLLASQKESYCSGLYLSARWFVLSECAEKGIHLIILPTRESAEYCASDLYQLIPGDKVFFIPDSGKNIEKSNYKASISVQRTSSIGKLVSYNPADDERLIFVSYPEALEEGVPAKKNVSDSILRLKKVKK
ncbi:MAG: hypothetical protein II465_00430 [Bacteroidales bacterium]|nr:hypothetical protein [Bacteroidales bacterium]